MPTSYFDSSVFVLNPEHWLALVPYLVLCLGIVLSVVASALTRSDVVVKGLLVVVFGAAFVGFLGSVSAPSVSIFGTSLFINSMVRATGAAVVLFALLAAIFQKGRGHSEWAPILLVSSLGLCLLPAARDWVAFFVFLETLSIAGYVLAAFDRDRQASLEAGLKYLLMGAFSSALFLMGLALIYGQFGTFAFDTIASQIKTLSAAHEPGMLSAGVLLVAASLSFKVALAPFHMWAPDVYQASPSGISSFLATATKIAVFMGMASSFEACGFFEAVPALKTFILVLGVSSVVVGSLLAVAQKKIRRMLAYSGIVNSGYASLALVLGTGGISSLFTFLVMYSLGLTGAIAMTEHFAKALGQADHEDVEIANLSKLSQAPGALMAAAVFSLCLFSLAGIPPLPGFFGKYLILKDLWNAAEWVPFASILLGTLLGLAYYLRTLVPLYLETSSATSKSQGWSSPSAMLVGFFVIVLMVLSLSGFGGYFNWAALMTGLAR